MKTLKFGDRFLSRNALAFGLLHDAVSEVVTNSSQAGMTQQDPWFAGLLGLYDRLDALEVQFTGLAGGAEPNPRMAAAAIQGLRPCMFEAVEVFTAPIGPKAEIPDMISQVRRLVADRLSRLSPAFNFPQPEEVDGYPPENLVIYDGFLWKDPWPWREVESHIEALSGGLLNAAAEADFDCRSYPHIGLAVRVLLLVRELLRPTKLEDPEPDLTAVMNPLLKGAQASTVMVFPTATASAEGMHQGDAEEAAEEALVHNPT